MKLGNIFRLLEQRYHAVLTMLDRFMLPVAVVDRDRRLILANRSLETVFSRKDGIGADHYGHLRLWDGEAQLDLHRAIDTLSATARGDGGDAVHLITARRPSGDHPLCLEVSPIRDTNRELDRGLYGAFVKVYDPACHPVVEVSSLSAVYGLTDAETSVTMMLVNGLDVETIAQTREASPATVRTQIKSILHKTDSASRADLIRRAVSAHLPVQDQSGDSAG